MCAHPCRPLSASARAADEWAVDAVARCLAWADARGYTSAALLGFCYGGGRAIDCLAAATASEWREIKAAVCFYATRIDVDALRAARRPLLLCFAGEDELVSREQIAEYESIANEAAAAGVPQHCAFAAGEPHGFAHQAGVGSAKARHDVHQMACSFLTMRGIGHWPQALDP